MWMILKPQISKMLLIPATILLILLFQNSVVFSQNSTDDSFEYSNVTSTPSTSLSSTSPSTTTTTAAANDDVTEQQQTFRPVLVQTDDSANLCANADSILTHPQGPFDVIIIGGGITGLVAAKTLLERGVGNFKVLEARDRLGGHFLTVQSQNGYVELGPEIQAVSRIDSLLHFAATQGLLIDNRDVNVSSSDPVLKTQEKVEISYREMEYLLAMVRKAIEKLKKSTPNPKMSCAQWIRDFVTENWKKQDLMLDFYLRTEGVAFGDDLTDCNLENLLRNVTSTENPFVRNTMTEVNIRYGHSKLIQALVSKVMTQSLTRDVRVSFNSEVRKIYWNVTCPTAPKMNDFVFVRLRTGALLRSRYLLSTLPIGVLKTPFSAPAFFPPLPDAKVKALDNIGVGCTLTIYLVFEQQFWPENSSGIWFIWQNSTGNFPEWVQHMVGFKQAKNQLNTLQVWFYGDWARQVELEPEASVTSTILDILNSTSDREVSSLLKMVRSRWCQDMYSMGTNSYMGLNTSRQDFAVVAQPLPSEEIPKVTFANDATHEEIFGTVEASWRSAVREADRLANVLGFVVVEDEKSSASVSVADNPNTNSKLVTKTKLSTTQKTAKSAASETTMAILQILMLTFAAALLYGL